MSGRENNPLTKDPELFKCRICGLLPKIPVVTYCRHTFCKNYQIKTKKRIGYRPEGLKAEKQMFQHYYI